MSEAQILIVEDDLDLREALVDTLNLAGLKNTAVESAEAAIILIREQQPDLVLTDVNMPGKDGFSLLNSLRRYLPEVPVLLMTAYGNVNEAVNAIQQGASDYLLKPFDPKVLIEKIKNCLPETVIDKDAPVAVDPKSQQILSIARRVAGSDASILISGESGTGKEVLAKYIHDHSERKDKKFIAINCAAIPENMLEATLFGYEKGAFTGAYKSHPGTFEQAQEGTLLLDEISEMPLSLQAKLLRVLQEREVERIGGNQVIKLNVRVVSTTNRDMKKEVEKNNFREDLYYRLNVFPVHWMPLRERPLDILPLAEYLLDKHASMASKQNLQLTDDAKQALKDYQWPGNAREMDNVIQRALILQNGTKINAQDIQFEVNKQVLDSEWLSEEQCVE